MVKSKLPKRVKKRRKVKVVETTTDPAASTDQTMTDITGATDTEAGWEEYYDYIFPEDEASGQKRSLKILEIAHKWKKDAMK